MSIFKAKKNKFVCTLNVLITRFNSPKKIKIICIGQSFLKQPPSCTIDTVLAIILFLSVV